MRTVLRDWEVSEYEYPSEARKEGGEDCRAFGARRDATHLGILTAIEPYQSDGSSGRHVSISKSHAGAPCEVTDRDIAIVWAILATRGIERPSAYDVAAFENGPFRNLGRHLWET